MCDVKSATKTIEQHFAETYSIFHMSPKAFKKFHRAYTGDDVSNDDLFEARILLVKMLLNTLISDCEVILDGYKKERDF